MELAQYLKLMVEKDASDIYLTTDAPPSIRIQGNMQTMDDRPLEEGAVDKMARSIMNEEQCAQFAKTGEMNLAYKSGVGRYRVNIFKQRTETGMVIRCIKTEIPTMESLGLPAILKELIMRKSGLILFVGATGTGKSTSLASLIDHRNQHEKGHILCIEEPIEFIQIHKMSLINQREVGMDTESYNSALENALRQAPDVIMVGEIRTKIAMEYALTFAETGHLCLSTLHAHNSNQAIERIINFFPHDRHAELLTSLSLNLAAVISQRLVRSKEGKRIAAFEIMLNSPMIADLIKQGKIESIKEIMQKSENIGMQTFDTALFNLYRDDKITLDEALLYADSPNNLQIRISLADENRELGDNKFSIQDEVPNNF